MSTEISIEQTTDPGAAVATRRIFRLAFGTSLSLLFSQIVNWDMSFLAPVFTMFLLAVPMPAPTLGKAIGLLVALLIPICVGIGIIPFLNDARWAGVIIVACGLYYSFYFTAKGGSPIIGTFFTLGLTMIVTIGSLSLDILLMLIEGLALGVIFGVVFVWIAHAIFPELPPPPGMPAQATTPANKPDLVEARRAAFRSMLITFPVTLILLFSPNSAAYIVVMMKVAAMGQQATTDHSRAMGKSLLESTFWGGLGAILAWQWLSIWPVLPIYVLMIAIASLLYGNRIFSGFGMHAKGGMWMYAFLTMIVVLAPAVMDSQGGASAGTAFYSRLFLISLVAVYGTIAVAVFDAFWKSKSPNSDTDYVEDITPL